jgi:hypothetical protein
MEDCWPSGVALRGETPSHLALRWLKTVVVSGWGKAHVMRQAGIRKTFQKVSRGLGGEGRGATP